MVLVNEWAISRDESLYPDASRFDPQRHLTAEGKLKDDPLAGHFAFGFGRRICPGRHFAELSLWAAMVSILSTVRITKAKDSEGRDILVIRNTLLVSPFNRNRLFAPSRVLICEGRNT